jgi:hypothetical protein
VRCRSERAPPRERARRRQRPSRPEP